MKEITAEEAAARLRVKKETLYAYVSRGLLTSARGVGGRTSAFDADEVEALAARTRRGGRAGALEVVVASGISLIQDDRLYYRGIPVDELARGTSFETVAEWLWTGDRSVFSRRPSWPPVPAAAVAHPGDHIDRLRMIVATASAADELRYDLEPASVVGTGRRLLASMVAGLPLLSAESSRPDLAARLWPRLAPQPATRSRAALLNAALVLLADHELAASTLAARVAASVRADPYSVVSTGLGVIAGALHGAASKPVVELFEEVGEPARTAKVIGERLRRGERLPGLGHKVYRAVDPRTGVLLEMLADLRSRRWAVVEAVEGLVRERLPLVVNIDFALGAMVFTTGMDADAAEAMFAVARTAGWLAHAIEEYAEPPVRFRPRAAYTGPRPD